MRPADIQGRDFLVGLRGYDRDEVRDFLAQVAAEHAAVLAELDEARHRSAPVAAPAPTEAPDEFENLGASVAAILRAAKDSASALAAEAEQAAEQVRDEAERHASAVRAQAEDALEQAKAEAERLVREATERARALEVEADARLRDRTESMLADAEARAAEAGRREAALRTRLQEAADEVSLALLALGEPSPSVAADVAADVPGDEHQAPPPEPDHQAWS